MSNIKMRPQAILDGHTTAGECTACGERFSNAGVPGAAGEAKLSAAFLWHVTQKHSPAASGPAPAAASRGPKKLLRPQYVAYAMAVIVVLIAANFAYRMYGSRQQTTAAYPIDQVLQNDVRSKLAASDVFAREQVDVSVHNGVATLSGTVHEGWKQLVAANLAAGVAGITEVKNLIKVREELQQPKAPWPQPTAESQPAKPPRRPIAPSPEERAQSLVDDGNWQLSHGHRDAAIKDFQAAIALDSHNYAARSGLQEAEHFQ